MLKWTSESEYFLSFEFFFADTIYIYNYIIQSKSNHFTPSAAHARRGVKSVDLYSRFPVGCPKIATRIRACAHLGGKEILRMREFSSQFLDNQLEIDCTPPGHHD